jgi:hypothetical protein
MMADDKKGCLAAVVVPLLVAVTTAFFGPLLLDLWKSEKLAERIKQALQRPVVEQVSGGGGKCSAFGAGLQMCWGKAQFTPRGDPGVPVCDYSLKFEKSFKEPPTVTTGVQAHTSGFAYAVYSQTVQVDGFEGALLEVMRRPSKEPVEVSYVAIGSPQ